LFHKHLCTFYGILTSTAHNVEEKENPDFLTFSAHKITKNNKKQQKPTENNRKQ